MARKLHKPSCPTGKTTTTVKQSTHLFFILKKFTPILKMSYGTSLAVQWLKLCASIARGMGLIPGQGSKIPHVAQNKNLKKKKTNPKKIKIYYN